MKREFEIDLKNIKPEDMGKIRLGYTALRDQLCSMMDGLSDDLKPHFAAVKKKYDDFLGGLPPSDQAPAALQANAHLSALYSSMCACSGMMDAMNSMFDAAKKNSAMNSEALDKLVQAKITSGELILKSAFDSKVDETVKAKLAELTKTGDYVDKATVQSLCSAALETGKVEGEKIVRLEFEKKDGDAKVIENRKALAQAAGLPLPADFAKIFAGTDEEFKARLDKASVRSEALRKGRQSLNSKSPLMAKVWLADGEYETFQSLLKETLGDEALAGSGRGEKPGAMIV